MIYDDNRNKGLWSLSDFLTGMLKNADESKLIISEEKYFTLRKLKVLQNKGAGGIFINK